VQETEQKTGYTIINTNLREKDLNMHGLAHLPKLDTAAHASTQKNHP
jgi:hypothetical protein